MYLQVIVSLRVWFPNVYGMHLLFVDGAPRGCIDDSYLTILRDKSSESASGENLKYLCKTLKINDLKNTRLFEIDPSVSTVVDDEIAGHFIPAFYDYFDSVFHEGSPFIDSDGDFLALISNYFPPNPNAIGVDVGAGSGRYARALAKKINKVYACDIATKRLNSINRKNIVVVKCDIQRMELPEKCDFAMCNFVLEHVADPYKVCMSIISNLKRGGRMLLAFPSFSYRDIYAAKHQGELATLNFEHLRSFSGESGVHPWEEKTSNITDYLSDNGCRILEIRGTNISIGLDAHTKSSIAPYIDNPVFDSSNMAPWNLYGQQTLIYAERQ